jgi:hypothetical protein
MSLKKRKECNDGDTICENRAIIPIVWATSAVHRAAVPTVSVEIRDERGARAASALPGVSGE